MHYVDKVSSDLTFYICNKVTSKSRSTLSLRHTGSHISEVLQESEALKERVKLLQLQNEQEKADAAQAKEELCR